MPERGWRWRHRSPLPCSPSSIAPTVPAVNFALVLSKYKKCDRTGNSMSSPLIKSSNCWAVCFTLTLDLSSFKSLFFNLTKSLSLVSHSTSATSLVILPLFQKTMAPIVSMHCYVLASKEQTCALHLNCHELVFSLRTMCRIFLFRVLFLMQIPGFFT